MEGRAPRVPISSLRLRRFRRATFGVGLVTRPSKRGSDAGFTATARIITLVTMSLPPFLRKFICAAIVLSALSTSARGPREVDFAPSAMGWRAQELRGWTNISREQFAVEVQKFREAGGKGEPEALLNLAVLYEKGFGLTTNLAEAAKLVRQAAEMGFAPAQNQLGLYFSDGIGVERNAKEAFRWWEKAAAQNYGPAEYLVGFCFLNGEGVETNFAKANDWFRKAAEHNVAAGMHNLAVSYARGRAIETNDDEAIRLLRRAIDLGSYRSATAAAALLTQKPRTREEGLRLARWAAEHDDTRAQDMLARLLVAGIGMPRNVEEGLRWIRRASGRGDFDADATLAQWHLDGTIQPRDVKAAMFLVEPAANAGHPASQNILGMIHCEGMGVATNFDAAMKWFRLAAAQNFAFAWLNLSRMHRNGWGVPKDVEEAARCDLRAAEFGASVGQLRTGTALFRGMGVKRDVREGIKWLTRAAAQAEPDALFLLNDALFALQLPIAEITNVVAAVHNAAEKGSVLASAIYGRMHVHGVIRPGDREIARSYLSYAATNGIVRSATHLGMSLLGTNLGPEEPQEAWKWITFAADRDDMLAEAMLATRAFRDGNVEAGTNWLMRGVQKEHGNCMFYLAELMIGGIRVPQDSKAGWELMRRAAEAGHAPAMTKIADQAFAPLSKEPIDKALEYYQHAAEQHWPRALTALGYLYCLGKQVSLNEQKGWDYLAQAALLEEPRAAYSWGLALWRGNRGITNVAEAARLLQMSAEQGFPAGMNAYGYLLAQGDAGRRDIVEAWKWYELAAAQKDLNAVANMRTLRKEISEEQIAQARRMAAAFKPVVRSTSAEMFPAGAKLRANR
jgi:TPR repeat protein